MENLKSAMLIERVILESLSRSSKSLEILSEDSGIESPLLKLLLQEMMFKGWIQYGKGEFSIETSTNKDWITAINSKESVQLEVKELMDSLVSMYFKENLGILKVQKISLSEDEEMVLNSHLKTLESFFVNLREKRVQKPLVSSIKKQKIVVWGAGIYKDLITTNLQLV
jgi:hypothetical protein